MNNVVLNFCQSFAEFWIYYKIRHYPPIQFYYCYYYKRHVYFLEFLVRKLLS